MGDAPPAEALGGSVPAETAVTGSPRVVAARRAVAVGIAVLVGAGWLFGLLLAIADARFGELVSGFGALAFAAVGVLIVWRRPANRLGWVFLATALTATVLGVGALYAAHGLKSSPRWPAATFVAWLSDLMATPLVGLLAGVLPQLFPTGRPLSPRWRWPLTAGFGYMALAAIGNGFYPQALESVAGMQNPYAIRSATHLLAFMIASSALLGVAALVGTIAALVVRWRRASAEGRQQLKWFLAAVSLLPVPLLLHNALPGFANPMLSIAFALLPLAIGVAILRYRLYDLDLLISRALGYALVSAAVAVVYLGIVGLAAFVLDSSVGLGWQIVATVVAAAAFQPLRSRLQRVVDHLFYGERSRPYEAVARLSRRLEGLLQPDLVLPAVVDTVSEALRLPYVAIALNEPDGYRIAAEHGHPKGPPRAYSMTYQGEEVGRMLACARSGGVEFDAIDDELLSDLARQAGVAAHAVRAAIALQRSRAELVTAREEERRRLRRDLHDGLGPALAGVTLGLHAVHSRIASDPDEAQRLVAAIETQVEEAIADIRRLVYGLRPPALDEFGLVRALQLHATRIENDRRDLSVVIDCPPEGLAPLPAAVEVAAYRIVTEALTNVTRHASAHHCMVQLSVNGALQLDVADDGIGLVPGQQAGVGITAMRERAAELGGTLVVEGLARGTRVRARLPVEGLL